MMALKADDGSAWLASTAFGALEMIAPKGENGS